ncbi:MAG: Rieske 2Fe-2S domain-containing protein [Bacteroidales bacterium]|nr:Rieske 2Fe-2S domain-containing protein [Bacteroidales bacterium]
MERRSFIRRISIALASIAGIFLGASFLKQFAHRHGEQGKRIRVGRLSDFPVDTYTYINDHKIFVYRDHEGIRSVSAVCTHLGCIIQRTDEGFECPCHGSCYSEEGKVVSGPAPTALAWYKMERTPDGKFIVDLDKKTGADEKLYFA